MPVIRVPSTPEMYDVSDFVMPGASIVTNPGT